MRENSPTEVHIPRILKQKAAVKLPLWLRTGGDRLNIYKIARNLPFMWNKRIAEALQGVIADGEVLERAVLRRLLTGECGKGMYLEQAELMPRRYVLQLSTAFNGQKVIAL